MLILQRICPLDQNAKLESHQSLLAVICWLSFPVLLTALGDVLDLPLDGHEQRLLGVRSALLPQLLRYWRRRGRLSQLPPTRRESGRCEESGRHLANRRRRRAGEHGQRDGRSSPPPTIRLPIESNQRFQHKPVSTQSKL
uniref:Uncharacterized protein n=1 Tax=Arundo donax TaxID=35708 RepID=A0A0A9H2Z6_ARUDO